MSVFVRQNNVCSDFKGSESWVILSTIERQIKEKIERIGKPLKDWDISINYGIKTGYNDAFIITGEKRKELIEQDPKSDEIIRPILRGRDIKRYGYNYADLWLIDTHNGVKEKGIKPINIYEFPAVKNHLDSFYSQLEKRADKGKTPHNLRNCAYMDDFYKKKIVWAELSRTGNSFTLDKSGFLLGNTGYILVVKENCNQDITYEYLVAMLNSKAILFYLDKISTRLDDTGWRWLRQYVEMLPIPQIDISKQNYIKNYVIKEMGAITSIGQNFINSYVNDLYEFSNEEIDFIQSQ